MIKKSIQPNNKMELLNTITNRQNDYLNYAGKFVNCSTCESRGDQNCTNSVINKELQHNNFLNRIELESALRGTSDLQKISKYDERIISKPPNELFKDHTSRDLCSINNQRQPICGNKKM